MSVQSEAEALLELGESLAAAVPRLGDALGPWRGDLHGLLERDRLETLAGERRLEVLTAELRETWLRAAHSYSNPQWKSPPHSLKRALPGGGTISYNYERALRPASLEARLAAFRPAPPDWNEAHLVFASGMAALATLLQAYPRLAQPRPEDPLLTAMLWGGYFETHIVLEALRGPGFAWSRARTQPELAEATRRGAYDLLILESVTYDYELSVFDLDAFAQAWAERSSNRPAGVLLDTTLTGDGLPHTSLLSALAKAPPPLVAVLSSGSKLGQQGLELSNVGLLSLYTPAGAPLSVERVANYLETLRSSFGTGLSLDELVVLEAPFFLDRGSSTAFARGVFDNNAVLARDVTSNDGLFRSVVHPTLGPAPRPGWAVGPFVVLELREDAPAHHRLLLAVVQEEARRRGVPLTLGSSFGFRGHRFEAIQPEPMGSKGLFKVAAGGHAGPALEAIVELFETLASLPDVQALRRSFAPGGASRAPR